MKGFIEDAKVKFIDDKHVECTYRVIIINRQNDQGMFVKKALLNQ